MTSPNPAGMRATPAPDMSPRTGAGGYLPEPVFTARQANLPAASVAGLFPFIAPHHTRLERLEARIAEQRAAHAPVRHLLRLYVRLKAVCAAKGGA